MIKKWLFVTQGTHREEVSRKETGSSHDFKAKLGFSSNRKFVNENFKM